MGRREEHDCATAVCAPSEKEEREELTPENCNLPRLEMSISSIVSRSAKRSYIVANNPATHVIGLS